MSEMHLNMIDRIPQPSSNNINVIRIKKQNTTQLSNLPGRQIQQLTLT